MTNTASDFVAETADLSAGAYLLAASAGTGKTWTIEALVVRLVTARDLPLPRILVVTFTRAATGELRERVRHRLRSAADVLAGTRPPGDPFDEALVAAAGAERATWARRAREAVLGFDAASIHTIHGFCQRVLQRYALECGVDFDVELSTDTDRLAKQIARDFHTRATWALSPADHNVLTHKYKVNRGAFEAIASAVQRSPDADFHPPRRDVVWSNARWRRRLDEMLELWDAHAEDALARLREEGGRFKGDLAPAKLDASAQRARAWLADAGGSAQSRGDIRKFVLHFTPAGLLAARKKAAVNADWTPPAHPLFDALAAFRGDCAQRAADRPQWAGNVLLDFAEEVRTELPRRRALAGEQSYDSLLHQLADALTRGPLRQQLVDKLRRDYGAALIDEFQDTDPAQWHIFRTLFVEDSPRPVFLVGDPKQSIYAFRGADIRAYQAAQRRARKPDLTLRKNFRSDRPLVHALRHLYVRSNVREVFGATGLPYPLVEHVRPARLADAAGRPSASLEIVQLARSEGDDGLLKVVEARHLMASLVAEDVARFLERKWQIGANEEQPADTPTEGRTVRPDDIAVLVRTHLEARAVREALALCGVPSVTHSVDSVLRQDEAADLRHLLRALAEPSDASRIRAALVGPILSLDAAALLALEESEHAWGEWAARFRTWSRAWERRGLVYAVRLVLEHSDAATRWLGQAGGRRRWTDFNHLLEVVHAAQSEQGLSSEGAVAWLEERIAETPAYDYGQEGESDVDPALFQLRLENDADAVEICTVHSAKGREWPVVFCPFAWRVEPEPGHTRAKRFPVETNASLCDYDVGLPEQSEYVQRRTLARDDAFAESLRLLYVALTRARHFTAAYTGAINAVWDSPIAYLLHQGDTTDLPPRKAVETRIQSATDAALFADLTALRDTAPGDVASAISVRLAAPAGNVTWSGQETTTPLRSRTWSGRRLDGWWRRASFSGLASHQKTTRHGALRGDPQRHEGAEYDAESDREARFDTEIPTAKRVLLHGFPGGTRGGTCMHAIFEHHDFAQPSQLAGVVSEHLEAAGYKDVDEPAAVAGIQQALDRPLPLWGGGSLPLAQLARADRLDEMAFDFRAGIDRHAVSSGTIADVIEREHDPAGPLSAAYAKQISSLRFQPFRGVVTGSIDLVFRQGGRWYLADYKSNNLGLLTEHYDAASLRRTMAESNYFLQYLLYSVALHRFLEQRLDGYGYDTHFGGAYYLFVRGMEGLDPQGPGVFFHRPKRGLILGLSDALDRPTPRSGRT